MVYRGTNGLLAEITSQQQQREKLTNNLQRTWPLTRSNYAYRRGLNSACADLVIMMCPLTMSITCYSQQLMNVTIINLCLVNMRPRFRSCKSRRIPCSWRIFHQGCCRSLSALLVLELAILCKQTKASQFIPHVLELNTFIPCPLYTREGQVVP
ncbi:hypothetical protein BDV34DRAFT_192113 [Aspergillus parasiticus]|uniref:Uncharacterized protein n=1 Tax=Aspergillus parasiticus TaxID=5067 RepID=A0A5N6DT49_ASPPA|nr:hypothetical protein BDV34DRAFT_192113 [Aspergillus parasiticus]